jgi:hypothetical protein
MHIYDIKTEQEKKSYWQRDTASGTNISKNYWAENEAKIPVFSPKLLLLVR